MNSKLIFPKEKDLTKWYTSVVLNSNIAEYGLVKGSLTLKPYGFAIWKQIQNVFSKYLDKTNTLDVLLPTLFPYSYLLKEKEHLDGFKPEIFLVSHLGEEKLDDPLVLRPTSEILFCNYFAKNIVSYKDLPLALNQWCSVFRAEKNPRPFLRNTEFFWQEQHAVFSNEKESADFALLMGQYQKQFLNEDLDIFTLFGIKTENEKFSGALTTYTNETFLDNAVALQIATSHDLNTYFTKPFEIHYQNQQNQKALCSQTSSGLSSRLIGAIISLLADNLGLVLPFNIAPIQFGIVTSDTSNKIYKYLQTILVSYRTKTFLIDNNFGSLLSKNEIEGIPFQLIIGKKEIENNSLTIYNRITAKKSTFSFQEITELFILDLVNQYKKAMFDKTANNFTNLVVEANNLEEFKNAINNNKIVKCYFYQTKEKEIQLKQLTNATARCIDLTVHEKKPCFMDKTQLGKLTYFARSY